jgi:hypothetical protein
MSSHVGSGLGNGIREERLGVLWKFAAVVRDLGSA